MTRSGWIRRPRRRWRSWRGGFLAERVGLIFAAREPGEQLRGLPELEVQGLQDQDAPGAVALRSFGFGWISGYEIASWPRPRAIRWRCSKATARAEPHPVGRADSGLVGRRHCHRRGSRRAIGVRLEALPAAHALAVAGRRGRTGRRPRTGSGEAAERLGIPTPAAVAAEADGLLEIGTQVHRFRHPPGAFGGVPVGFSAGAPGGAPGAWPR